MLVFTCIAYVPEARIIWQRNGEAVVVTENTVPPSIDDFTLQFVSYTERMIISRAMSNSGASMQLNGTTISCSPDGVHFESQMIIIAGKDLCP